MIHAHPEQWDQSGFCQTTECGTTYCLGGWVARLARPELDFTGYWGLRGHPENVLDVAREALGLTTEESFELFCDSDGVHTFEGLDDVIRAVTGLTFDGP